MPYLPMPRGTRRGTVTALPAAGRRTLATTALLAALCAAPARADVITYDMGGRVDDYIAQIERMRLARTPVRIVGTCVSACTLYLGLPQTCVARNARLGFHGPRTSLPGLPLPYDEFQRVTAQMASYYPPRIASWFMAEGRTRTDGWFEMSGAEAIALGARPCN